VSGQSSVIAAIGNFDGVHRGHGILIEKMREFAGRWRARSGAVVFNPHPRRFFRPGDPPFLITTAETRDALLLDAGVDVVLPLAFDKRLASLAPAAFVRDVLKSELGLGGVVVGADFRFGAGRAGDAGSLSSLCAEYDLASHIIEPLAESGHSDKIGSTTIREALLSGAVDRAAAMLGRLWRVEGVVESGNKVGRTLGFPTANLTLGELIEPRRGVYAVRVIVNGERFDGVANFGRRPTVGAPAPLLEVHLFDFARDIYGVRIAVDFVGFIRDEMKFQGLDALKAQIEKDCLVARTALR